LKNKFGNGYKLKLTLDNSDVEINPIFETVVKICPSAKMDDKIGRELTILIQSSDQKQFKNLFMELEKSKGQLGVSYFGISFSTLEDVFIKLVKEEETKNKP
jgi:ATP-binding cassette subfamily A (ABC1) protein 3